MTTDILHMYIYRDIFFSGSLFHNLCWLHQICHSLISYMEGKNWKRQFVSISCIFTDIPLFSFIIMCVPRKYFFPIVDLKSSERENFWWDSATAYELQQNRTRRVIEHKMDRMWRNARDNSVIFHHSIYSNCGEEEKRDELDFLSPFMTQYFLLYRREFSFPL